MNTPYTFIFVGRSGAGKGTQIELLKKFILEKHPAVDSYSFDMGSVFRSFLKNESPAATQVKQIMNNGKLIPDFLTCGLFTSALLENLTSEKHLYVDGIPRSNTQVDAVVQAMSFFDRKNTIIVDIFISSEEAKKRMMLRGRPDDTEDAVLSRFSFYENSVIPAVEYMKQTSGFTYIQINGEGSIESIHDALINALPF